jgi:hypothetical protein
MAFTGQLYVGIWILQQTLKLLTAIYWREKYQVTPHIKIQ